MQNQTNPDSVESKASLEKLSVVIPARNEEGSIASTLKHLHAELSLHKIPHEILVVDDGSVDQTWRILNGIKSDIPALRLLRNSGPHGFGHAVAYGIDRTEGDAVVIMMADESDDCRDVVKYWEELKKGCDCVFGSRFIPGGSAADYPWPKYLLNRLGNKWIQWMFGLEYNDVTNAFKAYRKEVLHHCRPFISHHFSLTVELPLKAIVRGYQWTVIPVNWKNRRSGLAKFKIQEISSPYLFVILSIWFEHLRCRVETFWRKLCGKNSRTLFKPLFGSRRVPQKGLANHPSSMPEPVDRKY